MAIKRFTAPSMPKALRLVSEQLGADAIILEQNRLGSGVELLATLDPSTAELYASQQRRRPRRERPAPRESAARPEPRPEPAAASAPSGEPALAAMRSELSNLRELMEQQFNSLAWGNYRQRNPGRAGMWRRLQRLGLSAPVCQRLIDQLPDLMPPPEAWRQLMRTLVATLPVRADDPVERGGVFVLTGPTGSGKTTTLGKLAARYVLSHGNDSVVLVTTDSYRLGAHDQLRTLARILDVPLKITEPGKPFRQLMAGLKRHDLVLVDSAGLGSNDPGMREQRESIEALGPRAQTLLVLSATTQAPVLATAIDNYRTANMGGIVLSKQDEAASLGEVLSLAVERDLPIVYSADGQGIPDDIRPADGTALVKRAIALARSVAADEERLAQAWGELAGVGHEAV